MSLVKLTAKTRNGKSYAKDILIDLKKVAEPIFQNTSNDCIISLVDTPDIFNHVNKGNNKVQYVVDETLVQIAALEETEMFIGTVLSRDGRASVNLSMIFILDKVNGLIAEDYFGSRFLYREEGALVPIEYVVSETPYEIMLATTEADFVTLNSEPLEYDALLSQNAPSGAKNANTAVAVMVLGQLWTVATVGSADFSNQELISGTMNVDGMVIRIIDAGGFTSGSFDSSLSYDGSPYVVSTDVNGDLNPFVNTTGVVPGIVYDGVGGYTFTMTGLMDIEKVSIIFGNVNGRVLGSIQDIDSFYVSTLDDINASSDDVLNYTPINIKIRP